MYHKLFRITLLYTAIAISLTACGPSTPALTPPTQALVANEVAPTTRTTIATNTPEPTATQVVLGVTTGVIAFQSNRDDKTELYVMNADGTNHTRLTNHEVDDSEPM